jgi:poly(ADP-ribose) glycohydrolase
MDAIYFRNPSIQYDMKCINRELIKAYACFRPRKPKKTPDVLFGIATGNWGCGAFNGDRQLKGKISVNTR